MKKLPWNDIWKEFHLWHHSLSQKCESCGSHSDPDWGEQMAAIERFTEKHLKRQKRKEAPRGEA